MPLLRRRRRLPLRRPGRHHARCLLARRIRKQDVRTRVEERERGWSVGCIGLAQAGCRCVDPFLFPQLASLLTVVSFGRTGISTILVWRIVAKQVCHVVLPPLFRFFAPLIRLPRRGYKPATECACEWDFTSKEGPATNAAHDPQTRHTLRQPRSTPSLRFSTSPPSLTKPKSRRASHAARPPRSPHPFRTAKTCGTARPSLLPLPAHSKPLLFTKQAEQPLLLIARRSRLPQRESRATSTRTS